MTTTTFDDHDDADDDVDEDKDDDLATLSNARYQESPHGALRVASLRVLPEPKSTERRVDEEERLSCLRGSERRVCISVRRANNRSAAERPR